MLSIIQQVTSNFRQPSVAVSLTLVRWRKRRDRPMAKSKFFRVNEKPLQDPDEREELIWRRNNYSTHMRAIRKLFTEQYLQRGASASSMSEVERQRYEDADFDRMLNVNKKWNEDVAREREIRTAKDALDALARTEGSIKKQEAKQVEDLLVKEEEIRYMKERGKEFVTEENLDAKIEELLDSKVDYNFAIDLDGSIHKPSEEIYALNDEELSKQIEQSQRRIVRPDFERNM